MHLPSPCWQFFTPIGLQRASFNQLLTPLLLISDVLYGRTLGRASTDQLDISSMLMATVCTAGILHPGGHE